MYSTHKSVKFVLPLHYICVAFIHKGNPMSCQCIVELGIRSVQSHKLIEGLLSLNKDMIF